MKLTKQNVESIEAEGREVVLWDSDLPGFGIRVKPSGLKSYIIQYRDGEGRSRRATLGRHGPLAASEARRIAAERLGAVRGGKEPPRVPRKLKPGGKDTIAGLAGRYMRDHALPRKTPRSAKEDQRLLDNRILPRLGGLPVAAISELDIRVLHEAMAGTPYEANRTLALIRKMLNLAEDWDLRSEGTNPCRKIRPYKEMRRARVLSTEELGRLGGELKDVERKFTEDLTVIAGLRLLLLTGCRLSEAVSLLWDDVDWKAGTIRLPGNGNGEEGRLLVLGKPALRVLGDLPYTSDFVLPALLDPEEPLSASTLEHAWRRIRTRAGLEDVRLHDLRNTFSAIAVSQGYALPLTDSLLGYKGTPSRDGFPAPSVERLREAANVVSKAMVERLTPPRKRKQAGKTGEKAKR